jgi:acyl-CoA synthetase (AMP-forming)/AMP-acid ligase II
MNIAMLLEMAADGMGDRVAVGSRTGGITYADLLDRARRAATVVDGAGAERVALVDVNSEAVPLLLYAGAIAGVPFAPLNFRLADDRLRAVVGEVAPAVAVADDRAAGRIAGAAGVTTLARADLFDRAARAEPLADRGDLDPEQVAVWLFTSGTSGAPKAALLRHRHLVSYVLSTVEFMAAGPDEATLVSVPPYHIAGLAVVLSSTYAGRRLVYLPQFDPEAWVELAGAEAVTHAMVVPTMLDRVLTAIEARGARLPALGHLSYGGGRMPVPVIERAMAVLGPEDHRAAHASDDPVARARLGSVGRPLPTLELEIRDPMGAPVPRGETGEICVRGDQIAGEYRGRSALTPDGWFPTNDAGRLDAGGYLYVEGRLDDVIVRGGENLSPGEIEDVLIAHPAVAQVGVVGVPDQEWGEVVAAAVVLEPGAQAGAPELQDWVRERLRSARTPVVVDVRADLPYNDTGKLLRRVLRDELAERRTTV